MPRTLSREARIARFCFAGMVLILLIVRLGWEIVTSIAVVLASLYLLARIVTPDKEIRRD